MIKGFNIDRDPYPVTWVMPEGGDPTILDWYVIFDSEIRKDLQSKVDRLNKIAVHYWTIHEEKSNYSVIVARKRDE